MCKKQLALKSTVCAMQCDTDLREVTVVLAVLNWKKFWNHGSEMADVSHKQFLSRNILQVQNKTNFGLVMLRLMTFAWGWFVASNMQSPDRH